MTELQKKIERIRQLDKDLIPEAIEDMNRYRAIAEACTPNYKNDGSQHTVPSSNSKEKAFAKHAEASERVDKLQDEIADLKIEVQKEIDKIKDDKQRRFAKLYYIDQLNQKAISRRAHYAYGTVRNVITNTRKTLNLSDDIK